MTDALGSLEVLNVGAGHLKLSYNAKDAPECERARRMVEEMLRRGYALFVQRGKDLVPVRRFDAKRGEYLITDVPGASATTPGTSATAPGMGMATCNRCGQPRHKGRCRATAVPMERTKAVAVGRSAGG